MRSPLLRRGVDLQSEPAASLPGEDRLLQLVDRIVAAVQAEPPQLQEHRTGRGVNEVVTQRDLDNGPRTFGDG